MLVIIDGSDVDTTKLCIPDCVSSIVSWLLAVQKNCGNEQIDFFETILKPEATPMIYLTNYEMACLRDS
jgi:hypothetical protein